MSTSILHSRAYQYPTAKAYVFSVSVLCLWKMADDPVESWKKQTQWYSDNIFSANWIELMNKLWNSTGRFSQDSLQSESSIRFKRWCENYSVNPRTSQAGSSSCQCSTTLYMMQKEMMNYVTMLQRQSKNMLEDFLAVIGLSWGLDPKRGGTELTVANHMALGIERLGKCCRISKIPAIRYSDVPAPWREDKQEAKEEERQQFTLTEVRKILSCSSRW